MQNQDIGEAAAARGNSLGAYEGIIAWIYGYGCGSGLFCYQP